MSMRTDIHRPAEADPAEYVCLGEFYQGTSDAAWDVYGEETARTDRRCAEHRPFAGNYARNGTCDHCGAHFAYGVAYLHTPTGEYVKVGHTCASHTFRYNERKTMLRDRARRAQAAAAERARIAAAAEAFTAEHPALVAALTAAADGNAFYTSLLANLARYGSLTDRQVAAAERALARDEERAAARAAEAALPTAPVVTGTATITGTVLGIRGRETRYGYTVKMRVRDDRGFTVWGTVPRALEDAEVGERVTFVATVDPSEDDPTFGFFKRPRQAAFIDRPAVDADPATDGEMLI